jgi:hypothetical protein
VDLLQDDAQTVGCSAYNDHLEEKNRANGSKTVKKKHQALLRKLGARD